MAEIGLRLDDALLARVEALCGEVERVSGSRPSRASMLRSVIECGVQSYEVRMRTVLSALAQPTEEEDQE